jgi:hypothetical protein
VDTSSQACPWCQRRLERVTTLVAGHAALVCRGCRAARLEYDDRWVGPPLTGNLAQVAKAIREAAEARNAPEPFDWNRVTWERLPS